MDQRSVITDRFHALMELEIERMKLQDELLRRANAGEVYYATSDMKTRTLSDGSVISVGQWRERSKCA